MSGLTTTVNKYFMHESFNPDQENKDSKDDTQAGTSWNGADKGECKAVWEQIDNISRYA